MANKDCDNADEHRNEVVTCPTSPTSPTDKGPKRVPLRPAEHVTGQHVRISSNPGDSDVDRIMSLLMKNRSWHKDFDTLLGQESTRMYIKDLVFQDTHLASYKGFVDKTKRRVDEKEMKEILLDSYRRGDLPKELVRHLLDDVGDDKKCEGIDTTQSRKAALN